MKLTLKELLEAVDFNNPVRIQIRDTDSGKFSIDKLLNELSSEDAYLYNFPVECMGVNVGDYDLEIWITLEEMHA